MLYIGSCRYMHGYDWGYFPARLHSTREIIFFLEHITKIEEVIKAHPSDLTRFIFGDIYDLRVKPHTMRFLAKKLDREIDAVILEISTRKVMYYKNTPLNHYYATLSPNRDYTFVSKILTDEEIEYDVKRIIELCKSVFNERIRIHIIPHLNLKTRLTNDYIPDRAAFVNLLEQLSTKYPFKLHNIGRYLENSNSDIFLEDYMPDGRHYAKNCKDTIKMVLVKEIYCR